MRVINNRAFAVTKNEEFSVNSSQFVISPVDGILHIKSIAEGQSSDVTVGTLVSTNYNLVKDSVVSAVYSIEPIDPTDVSEYVITW